MSLNKSRFTQLIKSASFKELFNELGWENLSLSVPVSLDDGKFTLIAVAEKRGFVIFVCSPDTNGKIPLSSIRKKIDQRITKLYYEHLIIYTDKENFQQIWQLVLRESDKPIVVRETPYFQSQHPELLFQKLSGLLFNLEDEDKVTLADVRSNVREQFNTNAEKVTKKFYVEFKGQHTAFLKFIEGIEDKVNKDWYASLMLNRLMFIYFIQKKGFLDNNINYLSDKLKDVQKRKGKDKFFSFYRNFLLVLFHQGLGNPERSEKLLKEIGKVPYLNGGLFDVHQVERDYKKIEIEDKAFDKIFKFFDEYNWHLDTKITATGKDINPDVIGYIFEKYINDRAAMGAYYTKEDITEYIAKNTVIPYLFDQVKKDCANAFKDESSLWKMFRDNPDRYIYDSVKHGIYDNVIASEAKQSEIKVRPLPDYIAIGLDTSKPNLIERRKDWNKTAPPEFALPTEIWREVVERRNSYFEIKTKIENGEIKEINDFITYNLNIRQFAQDAVQQYEGSDFINAFYKAITKITVLDPTCGSGAFLFAALNILEPLYYGCIERMKGFIEEDDKQNGKKFPQFRKVLEEITKHPNQQYYIYKSIILNNLYGVDIMNEAVEIAKLRLFLKLVAEVEVDYEKQNMGLEPLPDIDFNVRCGNTLVGFGRAEEVDKSVEGSFDETFLIDEIKKIKEEAEIVSKAFQRYKDSQLIIGNSTAQHNEAKQELNTRIFLLNEELNQYQARLYGVDPKKKKQYEPWKISHQPFHWFAEFYEIINTGGFSVILGNPPYVNFSKINYELSNRSFNCIPCKDLFAVTIERSINLIAEQGRNGFIVPLSALSTETMSPLRSKIFNNSKCIWNSYYSASDQPASLFSGVRHRLLITLNVVKLGSNSLKYSTNFLKWFSDERNNLLQNIIKYTKLDNPLPANAKISSTLEANILKKLYKQKTLNNYIREKGAILYYHNAPVHWGKVFDFIPYYSVDSEKIQSSHLKSIYLSSKSERDVIITLLNSSLFYWFNWQFSNCRDLGLKDIYRMNFSLENMEQNIVDQLVDLKEKLMNDFKTHKKIYQRVSNNVLTKFDSFYPQLSKHLIDKIDFLFAQHYGFTEEELDFIINYDIKYRMGKELEED